jgi:hypothetical protein
VLAFGDRLFEHEIRFAPSYPFQDVHYATTRCPAFCDRVLLSQSARPLISRVSRLPRSFGPLIRALFQPQYALIGSAHPMGDHKACTLSPIHTPIHSLSLPQPVFLAFDLMSGGLSDADSRRAHYVQPWVGARPLALCLETDV